MALWIAPAVAQPPPGESLVDTIAVVKRSIVALGTFEATRRPPALFQATGFVVDDGNHVLTNAHVIDLELAAKEQLSVFQMAGERLERRPATVVSVDPAHDVALLRIGGAPLPALRLAREELPEGTWIAFTGFPIGAVLGLYPVTHRGIVSAITPVASPQLSPSMLDVKMIRRLRAGYRVYQLDATAYPGNSGSPVYDPATGEVYAIVSSVFVKDTKERILQDPSGISYAIPIRYAAQLLDKLGN